jgi:hypothetical protein
LYQAKNFIKLKLYLRQNKDGLLLLGSGESERERERRNEDIDNV